MIVVGATLMYRHWMTDDDSAVAAVDETIVHTPSSSTPSRYHHNGLTPPAPPATGNIMEDIANGVTNGILANPKDGEEIRPDIKVDTGFVNEHGETVYADSEGHVQDHYMVAPSADKRRPDGDERGEERAARVYISSATHSYRRGFHLTVRYPSRYEIAYVF